MSAAPRPMSREEAAALLGVPPEATGRIVQQAFLRAARRVHPDVLPDADEAERRAAALRFDALVRARKVLLEPLPRVVVPPHGGAGRTSVTHAPDWVDAIHERGLANSLVLIALLSFLIVALVTIDSAVRENGPIPGAPVSSSSTAP